MQRRSRVIGGVLAAAGLTVSAPWVSQAAPPGPKTVTATLFERPFAQVAEACKDQLGPAGYGHVEVSPAAEHIQGGQWWTSYQPVSYKIAGQLGDRTAFKKMVDACHAAGVRVLADAVVNHMAAGSGTGTGGTVYSEYGYPGRYGDQDFHACRADIADYTDRGDVQNCELVGLPTSTRAATTYGPRSPVTSTTCGRWAWTASAWTPRSIWPPTTWRPSRAR